MVDIASNEAILLEDDPAAWLVCRNRGRGKLSFHVVWSNAAFFSVQEFSYDAERDVYICPADKELHFAPWHSTERSRRYRAYARYCNHCPLKAKCTTSKQGRSLCRSVDEEVLDRERAYHATEAYKKAYRKRSVWVEPLFAEAKDWHGMRRFRLRLLWRVNIEAF